MLSSVTSSLVRIVFKRRMVWIPFPDYNSFTLQDALKEYESQESVSFMVGKALEPNLSFFQALKRFLEGATNAQTVGRSVWLLFSS